jgi:hypothetical protein
MDIEKDRKYRRTWFLELRIAGPDSRERFLFFFNRLADRVPQHWNKVSLVLARYGGTTFQRITSEPISLLEIIYADG